VTEEEGKRSALTDNQEIDAKEVSTGTVRGDDCARTTEMRCSACELELILTSVVQGAAPGFEQHSFVCLACNSRVHRVVFMRNGLEHHTELMPIYHLAPSIVPAAAAQEEHNSGPGILGRLMGRFLQY
jgi:hypothetical protein